VAPETALTSSRAVEDCRVLSCIVYRDRYAFGLSQYTPVGVYPDHADVLAVARAPVWHQAPTLLILAVARQWHRAYTPVGVYPGHAGDSLWRDTLVVPRRNRSLLWQGG
jgi:hypothetical protein